MVGAADGRHQQVIETRRGGIGVLTGLRRIACECNDAIGRHFAEVLQGVYPADPVIDREAPLRLGS